MDTVGEEEPDPIKLKSVKNNKTFTVPQNDRVRELTLSRGRKGRIAIQESGRLLIFNLPAVVSHLWKTIGHQFLMLVVYSKLRHIF